jgi:hypothetical protein
VTRARSAAWWTAPSLLCLLLHWRGFTAWFRGDDFAWLGAGLYIRNFDDFLRALFSPQAQGTIRPLSERVFFMAGFSLFGLDALPFRVVVFATQFVNLALVAWIGARLTGLRAAGFCAAVFWVINGSLIEPLGWTCVYNQVLCGFFLLLAFHFLLRYIETGRRRYNFFQWAAFLLGFGALELMVVYPALAAAYTFLCARKYFRQTLPLFAVSIAYALLHNAVAPVQKTGDYAMHFTGAMFRTLTTYWTWSVGPTFLFTPFDLPNWMLPAGIAIVSVGLFVFLAAKLRARARAAGFCIVWYLVTIAPVLPLRDHLTDYYVYLPVIGLCWLGGWAAVEAWRARLRFRVAAVSVALIYALMVVPDVVAASALKHAISLRVRTLVEGVTRAHELHPAKAILLEGVDSDLFWNGVLDRPFRLSGIDHIYLAPGSEKRIAAHPDLGDIQEFILPAGVVTQALGRDELVVYDVRGPRLRNITGIFAALPRAGGLPLRVDIGSPLTSYLLGPEWYKSDGDHRWMPKRATLRMAAPSAAGQKLYLRGECPGEQLRAGPLPVTVADNGSPFPAASIRPGENAFELSFPLPDWLVGKPELLVAVEVARTFRPESDQRDLGLAFGVFEVK